MRRAWIEFLREEGGATVLEYAWIASLISIAAVAVLYNIRNKMQSWYQAAIDNLAS